MDIIKRMRSVMRSKELDLKTVDLNTLIGDVTKFLKMKEMLTQTIALVSEPEDNLPFVWADAIHLQQVLINLIQNSRESMMDCEQSPCEIGIASQKSDNKSVTQSFHLRYRFVKRST